MSAAGEVSRSAISSRRVTVWRPPTKVTVAGMGIGPTITALTLGDLQALVAAAEVAGIDPATPIRVLDQTNKPALVAQRVEIVDRTDMTRPEAGHRAVWEPVHTPDGGTS